MTSSKTRAVDLDDLAPHELDCLVADLESDRGCTCRGPALVAEIERLRELNRDTRDRLADWHEDNYEVMTLVDGATNNEGRPSLAIIAAVRAWLDSVPT